MTEADKADLVKEIVEGVDPVQLVTTPKPAWFSPPAAGVILNGGATALSLGVTGVALNCVGIGVTLNFAESLGVGGAFFGSVLDAAVYHNIVKLEGATNDVSVEEVQEDVEKSEKKASDSETIVQENDSSTDSEN